MLKTQWQAIEQNDAQYDGTFWYAVQTTKIFCRPSCPSRLPKPEHILIYQTPEAAMAAGYRPCKRCRPLNQPVDNQTWVAEINTILAQNYAQPFSLEQLAQTVHGSKSYLWHVYKAITGLTPQQKLMAIRLTQAKQRLATSSESITTIGQQVGLTNTAYFIKKFREAYGLTPKQYQLQQKKL
ncbi:bifunctional transcriptional activator/DNA repair enzyme AdaA [Agrilactobacillus yilanensis]|uniref:Bifunctional transcriptional activator/DNA repair enzyme AdaA n=1 Tax=Agrilactobacillus yilanensis TaxID=2485997 RepID=A0ABW4J6J6_9LACO|nr:bifunctional transcriptional activator/DNA repair enzyme AdaA [Agrilactobacillus yilanensis]